MCNKMRGGADANGLSDLNLKLSLWSQFSTVFVGIFDGRVLIGAGFAQRLLLQTLT